MPAPSRWMIRCSLIYLLTGFLIGALMLISKVQPTFAWVWALLPIHIEILIFGWIIQFTMGTAYWIFPRFLEDKSRGNITLANNMVMILNSGIIINILTYLHFFSYRFTILGRSLEVLAVILFVILHWKRAVSYRG